MSIINGNGMSISFECSDLIEELESDISEFGNDLIVEVITEKIGDTKVYKDYNFIGSDAMDTFALKGNEEIQKISAPELLSIYKQQNKIF